MEVAEAKEAKEANEAKFSSVVTVSESQVKKLRKPQLFSQNSVNFEIKTSSTNESFYWEELMEPFNKVLTLV